MKTANDYSGLTDNERLEAAVREREGDVVVIPARQCEIESERTWWLLDRAILLPSNITVILQNCHIKLSDRCRDNFFRSANCGLGIENPEPAENIHVIGVGDCVLEGANHPRSTGDGSKHLGCPCPKNFTGAAEPTFIDLHTHSYGTDAGVEGEVQTGDWRNIGILMAKVNHFSIENVRIVESHAWAISLEECAYGKLDNIEFKQCMTRVIDGSEHNVENQDGIDLRNGCHDIRISNITGTTGDDVIALTAIASTFRPRKAGILGTMHVAGNIWDHREKSIYNVIIDNVLAYSAGNRHIVRLLATDGAEVRNVAINNIVDGSPDDFHGSCLVCCGGAPGIIGEPHYPYGMVHEQCLFNINISNVVSNTRKGIYIPGGLTNSNISNFIRRNPTGKTVLIDHPELLENVILTGVHQ
ncbi:MAG: hypothetical protein IKR13_03215 [Victivallales bacterium]|nr:hypothetical protein [Victivallales bacterium]